MKGIVVIICWLFCIAFIAGVVYFFYRIFRDSFNRIGEVNKDKVEFNSKDHGTLNHISGLPLVQGVPVDVMYTADEIIFKKDNAIITVKKEKIISIDRTTGDNIRNLAAGAFIGSHIIGGTGGAILGAAAATKFYLIISYNSAGDNKYIILEEALSGSFASRLKKDFEKSNNSMKTNIEL